MKALRALHYEIESNENTLILIVLHEAVQHVHID